MQQLNKAKNSVERCFLFFPGLHLLQIILTGSIFPYLTQQSSLSSTMHSLAVWRAYPMRCGTLLCANVHQTQTTETKVLETQGGGEGGGGRAEKKETNIIRTFNSFNPLLIKILTAAHSSCISDLCAMMGTYFYF